MPRSDRLCSGCLEAGGQVSPPLAWDHIVLSPIWGPLGLPVTAVRVLAHTVIKTI